VEHAADVTALGVWEAWEVTIANLLRLTYPPLALVFEAWRRSAKVAALAQLHADFDHAFLRNTRARALGNCVRFGASADGTAAWIDVLVSDSGAGMGEADVSIKTCVITALLLSCWPSRPSLAGHCWCSSGTATLAGRDTVLRRWLLCISVQVVSFMYLTSLIIILSFCSQN
jgi:hypothetical protein